MPPHSREELSDALERLGKLVDLAECRIDTEARAHSTVEAQAPYERLRTVLARPDGDAAAIKQRSDVMRMRAVDHEADHAATILCRTKHAYPGNRREPRERVIRQRSLVRRDGIEADAVNEADGRTEADHFDDGRRSRLELVGNLGPRAPLERHRGDHIAATQERRHLLK